jgi:hypothetical protein
MATQSNRVLEMLKSAGSSGVMNYDFVNRYILRAAARIEELRKEGHNIKTIRVSQGRWKYVLENVAENKTNWRIAKKIEKQKELVERGQGVLI